MDRTSRFSDQVPLSCEKDHIPANVNQDRCSIRPVLSLETRYDASLAPRYNIVPPWDDEHDALAPYPCLHCRRRCNTIDELNQHQSWHKRENQCTLCNKTFATTDIFRSHIRKHYVDATKDYSVNNQILDTPVSCRFCPELFPTLRDLQLHTKFHSDLYAECPTCGQYAPSCHRHMEKPADPYRHYLITSTAQSRIKQTSKDKPRIHSSISTYRYHLNNDSHRPFKCDICCKRFGKSKDLEQHLNDHYTEHTLLYDTSCKFPFSRRLELKSEGKDQSMVSH